jgi:hypothetical protein
VSAFDRAMGEAERYRVLYERGDAVLAEQAHQTIDDLVGRFVDGDLLLPRPVAEAMGRPELAETAACRALEVSS